MKKKFEKKYFLSEIIGPQTKTYDAPVMLALNHFSKSLITS